MINNQKYLNENYPKEERSKTKEIYLNEPDLEGELDLGDFTKLERVYFPYYLDESKLTITNKSEEVQIIKLKNSQECIKKIEEEIQEVRNKYLQTSQDLTRKQIEREKILEKKLENQSDQEINYLTTRKSSLKAKEDNLRRQIAKLGAEPVQVKNESKISQEEWEKNKQTSWWTYCLWGGGIGILLLVWYIVKKFGIK